MRNGTDEALQAAKADGAYLRQILSVDKLGDHLSCPLCGKKNLTVRRCNNSQNYEWACYTVGCGPQGPNGTKHGSIVDALMFATGCNIGQAIVEAKRRHVSPQLRQHVKSATAQEEQVKSQSQSRECVLNLPRTERVVESANRFLLNNMQYCTQFRRGLSEEIVRKYRVGLIVNDNLDYNTGTWPQKATWILPITNSQEQLKAVKLHFQIQPMSRGTPAEGKNRWLPHGTLPKVDPARGIQPIHSFHTLWPHPDTLQPSCPEFQHVDPNYFMQGLSKGDPLKTDYDNALEEILIDIAQRERTDYDTARQIYFTEASGKAMARFSHRVTKSMERTSERKTPWHDYVFILPGELKALAMLSMGYMATAWTGGESQIPDASLLASFRHRKVCIFRDDDPPKKILVPDRSPDPSKRKMIEQIRHAGTVWSENLAAALHKYGPTEIVIKGGGHKEK